MANWISSKLKAAESILQQIDNQAAESLGKNERIRSEEPSVDSHAKIGSSVSLKDQLKKKPPEDSNYNLKLHSDHNFRQINNNNNDGRKESVSAPKISPKSGPALTDGDWTQLLSMPKNHSAASGGNNSNGVNAIRGLNKSNRRHRNLSPKVLVSEVKRSQKSGESASKSSPKIDSVKEVKLSGKGKASDGEESTSSGSAGRHSNVESETDRMHARKEGLGSEESVAGQVVEKDRKGNEGNGSSVDDRQLSRLESLQSPNKTLDVKTGLEVAHDQSRSTIKGKVGLDAVSGNAISDLKSVSSVLSDVSDSDSDSSSSGSESEREREERKKRRERLLAEKAAAKAIEAIKEREDLVAKLEGEKQSLEKILEERAKQQAEEASQLQTTMMETMEAVELEKQKHNTTRMEVLARLAKLETANADLARFLAAAQYNLEVEAKRVAELRQQIVSKELIHEELRRSMKNPLQTGSAKTKSALKGVEFEKEILEAEVAFIDDKVAQLQDKVRKLEADIELTRKDIEEPTEVEVELKRRLSQMTDHLIQKQAKVEALSSEKASLVFRIETVSRLLDENMTELGAANASSSMDLESGIWELSNSKLQERYRSGKKQLGSLLRQLDHIFVVGALFLRRNPTAKLWGSIYVICLHLWVFYIFMSHSGAPNDTISKSGAVISLENINNTGGL